MVVHVRDEENADRSVILRELSLALRRRGVGGDDAVERTGGIALAGLVVDDERDLSANGLSLQVVVLDLRRRDAEAGEHHGSSCGGRGAEALRIEVRAVRARLR